LREVRRRGDSGRERECVCTEVELDVKGYDDQEEVKREIEEGRR
jgi:hypothetical protein